MISCDFYFRCLCKPGYKPHLTNHHKCVDFDECAEMTAHCPPNSSCKNRNGSYECKCNKGFSSRSSDQDSPSYNEAIHCIPTIDNMQDKEDYGNGAAKNKGKKKRKKKVRQPNPDCRTPIYGF